MTALYLTFIILFGCACLTMMILNFVRAKRTIKNNSIITVDFKEEFKKSFLFTGIAAIAALLVALITLISVRENIGVYEWVALLVGLPLFVFLGTSSVVAMRFKHSNQVKDEKLNKFFHYYYMFGLASSIIAAICAIDAFAWAFQYPLVNALNFTKGWLTPGVKGSGLTITFYALAILSGAVFVYILCDQKYYEQYGEHGILESTFFIAFPSGIVGARLFYVLGEWKSFFPINDTNHLWYKPFAVWEGGLTILGGAVCGIVVGALWFKLHKKKYSLRLATDIIVPTILIAQAVGRWGNFFNTEVHGLAVDEANFAWLPKFVYNNIHYGLGSGTLAGSGKVFVPLFLIESLTNLFGYFVLAHLFGKKFRKYTELGDLAYGYIIWYGMTRVILEPMRHQNFIMSDLWSWYWSLVFVFVGACAIVGNHVIEYIKAKKKNELVIKKSWKKYSWIQLGSVGAISLASIVVGIVTMANAPIHEFVLPSSQFNVGFIFLVSGVALLLFITMPIIHIVEVNKNKETVSE